MRKLSGSVMLATAGLLLAACGGGATVDNQNAPQATVAPLSKAHSSAAEKPSGSATAQPSSLATSEASRSNGGGAVAPAPKDQAAQEVTALPSGGPKRTDAETKYLGKLKEQGIKVEGIEDQMIGAANQVCMQEKGNYLLGAIAGQVVEQQRSQKKPEEVADIISKSAKDGYC